MTTPTMTRRILVPLDGGDLSLSALPFLRALATPESEIILLHIVPDGSGLIDRLASPGASADDIVQKSIASGEEYLARIQDGLEATTPDTTTLTRVGRPADEILRVSEELDVSLILMATNGHGPVGRMILGSVADRIMQSAMMPVLLFRPDKVTLPFSDDLNVPLRRVVVPLDGSDKARESLAPATELATQFGVPIHLVRVIAVEDHLDLDVDALKADFGTLMEQISTLRTAIMGELEDDASTIREQGVETGTEVLTGPAASGIMELLRPGDLVVMTSHGEGGVRRWLVGSVAEKLIQGSVAPVVLIPSAERAAITTSLRSPASPEQVGKRQT